MQDLALDSFADCDNLRRVMYGGSRRDFSNLVDAQLDIDDWRDDNNWREDHSLYNVRLFPRTIVTGLREVDVMLAVAGRVIGYLRILGAVGLIVCIIVKIKKKSERSW